MASFSLPQAKSCCRPVDRCCSENGAGDKIDDRSANQQAAENEQRLFLWFHGVFQVILKTKNI